jgi:hypothetical protein
MKTNMHISDIRLFPIRFHPYIGLSNLLVNSGKINVEYIEDLEGHRKQWVNDDIYYMLGRGGHGYFSRFKAIIKN